MDKILKQEPTCYYIRDKIGCLLVRGIFLPAAQLFVIAIEDILRGVCGQFNYVAVGVRIANYESRLFVINFLSVLVRLSSIHSSSVGSRLLFDSSES